MFSFTESTQHPIHVRRLLTRIGCCVVLAILASCNFTDTYNHYEYVNNEGWIRTDTLTFGIPRQQKGTYSLNMGFRSTQAFPYQQLIVIMQRTIYPSRTTHQDTIRCMVTNTEGTPVGKPGISNSEHLYRITDIRLHDGDSIAVKVYHCMEPDPLPGLTDVGINLQKK